MDPIQPAAIRYIKLGETNRWAEAAIAAGELHFGYREVPHDICQRGDWNAVAAALAHAKGQNISEVNGGIREIKAFYGLGTDCLWITFFKKKLWWCFAVPEVHWVGGKESQAPRLRKTVSGWHSTDITGVPLSTDRLSSNLTQLTSYRMTICEVSTPAYLLRRINALEEPILQKAREARTLMIEAAVEMIRGLHWAEFEVMVDLIFARGGWQRISRLGETQADVDLVIQHPMTKAKAFVQVKSRANQKIVDDYIARYRSAGSFNHMFFICHTSTKPLRTDGSGDVYLWQGSALAEAAISAGLYDWLIERAG